MSTLYLLTGTPGAGKTEFVKEWLDNDQGVDTTWRVFCPDDYYAKINGSDLIHTNSFEVWIAMYQDINQAMKDGCNVVIDTNSPTETMREQFIDWFPNFDYYVLVQILADYPTCNRNNSNRERKIPQDKFDTLYKTYKDPRQDKSLDRWDAFYTYENKNNTYHIL